MNYENREMSVHRTKKQPPAEMLTPLPAGTQARAEAKVGTTNVARLGWLLDLLNSHRETTAANDEQERFNLEAEVVAFAKPVGRASGGERSQLSRKEIQELVRDIRASILAMLQGATFEIDIPKLTFTSSAGSLPVYIGHPKAIFRLAVAKLMEADQQRIKICTRPGCGRLFARRKRGLFCSPQCTQIEQFKRYLARHSPEDLS
jgi:hypothetical protein